MRSRVVTFIVTIILLHCGVFSFSQITDSAGRHVGQLNEGVKSSKHESASAESFKDEFDERPDTAIHRIKFSQEDDSIKAYKRDKNFAYMRYLDSMLRVNKGLKVDTISVNNVNSKQKRNGASETVDVPSNDGSIFQNAFVKILFWILAAFFIGFIIYKLFLSEGFFRGNTKQQAAASDEPDEHNLGESEYDSLIKQALANRNFRLAIRYLYLQTLQKLSTAGVIHFSVDKTNYEYVREVTGKPYQNNFASLTLNYEYIWYGKFDIGEDVYQRLQTDFRSFQQKL